MNPKINTDIFKKHNVKLAYLFGSQAKGNAVSESDFDIAVFFKKPPANALALEEITFLSLDLGKFFPTELNIVSLNNAPSLLKYEVIRYGQLLYYENAVERIEFEVSVIKNYIDEEPLRKLYNQALHERILRGT